MTATITALYDALDEPDANVPMILGALADAYEDAGDRVRARVIRWCWRKEKEPSFHVIDYSNGGAWHWWRRGWPDAVDSVSDEVWFLGDVLGYHFDRSTAFRVLADACAEWVERRRGTA